MLDNILEEFIDALMRIYDLPIVPEFAEFLTGETAFLWYLEQSGGSAGPTEASRKLGVSKGRITAMSVSLTKKGLVITEKPGGDKRKVTVSLTAEGRKRIVSRRGKINSYLLEYYRKIGSSDVREFIRLLNKTADVMGTER